MIKKATTWKEKTRKRSSNLNQKEKTALNWIKTSRVMRRGRRQVSRQRHPCNWALWCAAASQCLAFCGPFPRAPRANPSSWRSASTLWSAMPRSPPSRCMCSARRPSGASCSQKQQTKLLTLSSCLSREWRSSRRVTSRATSKTSGSGSSVSHIKRKWWYLSRKERLGHIVLRVAQRNRTQYIREQGKWQSQRKVLRLLWSGSQFTLLETQQIRRCPRNIKVYGALSNSLTLLSRSSSQSGVPHRDNCRIRRAFSKSGFPSWKKEEVQPRNASA